MNERRPSRFQTKLFKRLTITFVSAVLFLLFAYAGVHSSMKSENCVTCHNNNPEYYTWKASTHQNVECVQCHVEPGVKGFVAAQVGGVESLVKKMTDNYGAPIVQANAISDAACERCHEMDQRNTTPSGDLIIPHDKHKLKEVPCVKCHANVAHGGVADKGVTFKTDYARWNESSGKSLMKNPKHIRPEMITCMNCHEVKNAPLECEACHTTKMVPDSHKKKDFLDTGKHGIMARDELLECDFCHSFMSKDPIEDLKELPASGQFLQSNGKKVEKKTKFSVIQVQKYSKDNTYCKGCHSTRPKSHVKENFNHGNLVNDNPERCFTCHEYKIISRSQKIVTEVACGTCHPASHKGFDYSRHPIQIDGSKYVQESCSDCHDISYCQECHVPKDKKKKT